MKKENRSKGTSKAQYQPNRQRSAAKKIGPIIMPLMIKSNDTAVQVNNNQRSTPSNDVIIMKESGVSDIRTALSVNRPLRPNKFTITVDSTGAGAVSATIAVFNNAINQIFQARSTDNVTTFSYSDGWSGKYMDIMLAQAGVEGLQCYGFNVSCVDQNGVRNNDSINQMMAAMLYYTGFSNRSVPGEFDLNGLERKTDQKSGIETVRVMFNVNALSQFVYTQPADRVFQFTFFFTPDF